MNCADMVVMVERYHAGNLPRLDAEAVERHLLACDGCRADFRFQRTLLGQVAALPREILPPEGTWDGIHRRIRETRAAPRWWQRRSLLAAAAVLLIVATASVTALVVRRPGEPPARSFLVTQAAYEQAALELGRTLEVRRKDLSPAALAVVEHNLRIIDEAIRETQAALAQDPGNERVTTLLWASWEKKIDLLERAAENAES
jgi:predicted anti-sigma-YlaC factor YlaD